jgi:hypothetical protein
LPVTVVDHVWKKLHTIRALTVNATPSTPHHLKIRAWGREFRVVPSEALRKSTKESDCDVSVEVVGPLVPGEAQTRLPSPVLEIDAEVSPEYAAFSYADDDITAVTGVASSQAMVSSGSRDGHGG